MAEVGNKLLTKVLYESDPFIRSRSGFQWKYEELEIESTYLNGNIDRLSIPRIGLEPILQERFGASQLDQLAVFHLRGSTLLLVKNISVTKPSGYSLTGEKVRFYPTSATITSSEEGPLKFAEDHLRERGFAEYKIVRKRVVKI